MLSKTQSDFSETQKIPYFSRHIYHKSCIDPWLLEHRTCPMCKNDILKHFGYWNDIRNDIQMPTNSRGIADDFTIRLELGEQEHQAPSADVISPEANSDTSDSQGFSFDNSEHHHSESFGYGTSTVPPQLVLNASNAKSFVMPLSSRGVSQGPQASRDFRSARAPRDHRASLHELPRPQTSAASQGQIVNLVQVRRKILIENLSSR